jgi:nucleoside-diphosphate-sugar epimerase
MKILILGGTGFIGKSISRSLKDHDVTSIGSKFHNFKKEPDHSLFDKDLDVIINCCGWFGGIPFNRKHGKEVYNTNSLINSNIGKLVQILNPKRYIKIVSGCVYPSIAGKMTEELIKQKYNYHETVKWSAIANKEDIEFLTQSNLNYDILLVTNTYGPAEHLSFEKSHIVGSVINKFLQHTNSIEMFGTGIANRDFLFSLDLGKIIKKIITHTTSTKDIYNISTGETYTIRDVVEYIKKEFNPNIKLIWGEATDNGVLEKSLDNTKLVNWVGPIDLTPIDDGIKETVKYFKNKIID